MFHQLVVGTGMIGRPLAERLAARGDQVTVGTRSGATVAGTQSLVLNASDPHAFTRAATDMTTIFLCTNPRYTDWPTQWPPVVDAAIAAASATGARLVVMGNLYPYGSPTGPMTDTSDRLVNMAQIMNTGSPQAVALGLRTIEISPGRVVMTAPYREDLIGNPATGVVAGGVVDQPVEHRVGFRAGAGGVPFHEAPQPRWIVGGGDGGEVKQ